MEKEKFKKYLNTVRKKEGKKIVKKISFATEKWINNYFKGVKIGAIPPIGKLFKLPVFADKLLLKNKKIYISSGNYNDSIIITPASLDKTADEIFKGNFSVPKKKIKRKAIRKK